jgi:hypothetical protein
LITLISSAHAGEQKATAQTDTATPIENPPLPRPKPSILIERVACRHGVRLLLRNTRKYWADGD